MLGLLSQGWGLFLLGVSAADFPASSPVPWQPGLQLLGLPGSLAMLSVPWCPRLPLPCSSASLLLLSELHVSVVAERARGGTDRKHFTSSWGNLGPFPLPRSWTYTQQWTNNSPGTYLVKFYAPAKKNIQLWGFLNNCFSNPFPFYYFCKPALFWCTYGLFLISSCFSILLHYCFYHCFLVVLFTLSICFLMQCAISSILLRQPINILNKSPITVQYKWNLCCSAPRSGFFAVWQILLWDEAPLDRVEYDSKQTCLAHLL